MLIDVSFRILGEAVPMDHGYPLYSALSRLRPALHNADWLAIHPINGLHAGSNYLRLTKNSRLRLRIPLERLSEVMPLAGKSLTLGNGSGIVRVGVPEVFMLKPASLLRSRCVVIKVSEVEKTGRAISREMFLDAARVQMKSKGINGELRVDEQLDARGREKSRHVIRIKEHVVVGYTLWVSGLSDEDSLKLQESGLGGRRRMGCGIFVPVKRREQ